MRSSRRAAHVGLFAHRGARVEQHAYLRLSPDNDVPVLPAPVTSFPAGKTVRLCFMGLDAGTCDRLRALGVREGCHACVMATGDKCVLALGASRVALRREVAAGLFATEAV